MSFQRGKHVAPSTYETAFNCPHCGALAKQFWYSGNAKEISNDAKKPLLFSEAKITAAERKLSEIIDVEERREQKKFLQLLRKYASGRLFLQDASVDYCDEIGNLFVSKCFNCNEIAIWRYDSMIWPDAGDAPPPNSDLPEDVLREYEEASRILNMSPRGSAAFLRVAVQRLCKHLGAKGRKIDEDIAFLVAKGLDEEIQQALDVVRVYGNDAVHPGQIDALDDRATAETLFNLVNVIADKMISQKKRIAEIYKSIPPEKLKAIEERNEKAKNGK